MASMSISLPNAMKEWVKQQAKSRRYRNSSDYICDLIRQDQDKAEQNCKHTEARQRRH